MSNGEFIAAVFIVCLTLVAGMLMWHDVVTHRVSLKTEGQYGKVSAETLYDSRRPPILELKP